MTSPTPSEAAVRALADQLPPFPSEKISKIVRGLARSGFMIVPIPPETAVERAFPGGVYAKPCSLCGYMPDFCRCTDEEIAAALATLSPSPGAGWVLVPREPTREMWAASGDAVVKLHLAMNHDKISDTVWRAMIEAAPPSIQPEAEGEHLRRRNTP